MRRREFVSLLGGAAAWPVTAGAQQRTMPVVGYLHLTSPETNAAGLAAFRKGLSEAGYVEGRNLMIEYRWAYDDPGRLPELAADLIRRRVAVIATPGSSPAAFAAKAATTTIPILFATGADPVQLGLVASFNRPSGNVTGVSVMTQETGAKRLGLLHELLPRAAHFGLLVVSNDQGSEPAVREVQAAASTIGVRMEVFYVGNSRDISTAFGSLAQMRVDALLVNAGALFVSRRVQLATLATRHAVPAIYGSRENADAGGLMSYGADFNDMWRQAGIYTGRILKGEKPADLPIMQPTKFEFVINLHCQIVVAYFQRLSQSVCQILTRSLTVLFPISSLPTRCAAL